MFNVHWLLRTKSKNTSIYIYSFRTLTFNFEQAVIFDNFIVEFSEHVSVIVDKFEELSSYSPEIILANGEAWGNLWDGLGGIGDKLFTEIYNPLLDEISDSLIRILHGFNLLGQSWLLLLRQVVVDFLHNLNSDRRQDLQEIVVLVEVLKENIDVFLHLLLDSLAVHGNDESVEMTEGDEEDRGADGGPLHLVPQCEDPLGVHHQGLGERVVVVPLKDLHVALVEDPGSEELLVFRIVNLGLAGRVPDEPLPGADEAVLLRVQELLELLLLVLLALFLNRWSNGLDGKVCHVKLHYLQSLHDASEHLHHVRLLLEDGDLLVPDRGAEHPHDAEDVPGVLTELQHLGVDLLLDHLKVQDTLDLLLQLLMLGQQDGVEHRLDLHEELDGLGVYRRVLRQLFR